MKLLNGSRKGAASFYIVAFSTLILVVIATGFATIILNEITRTSNDDLSQSAYDSAMAGVEDAKVAFTNYQRCKEAGAVAKQPTPNGTPTCEEIVWLVEKSPEDEKCYTVARILGRIGKTDKGEVSISETTESGSNKNNGLNQAYTCVELDSTLSSYTASLSSTTSEKVVRVKLDGTSAKNINAVKISWYSNRDGVDYFYSNYDYNLTNNKTGRVIFRPVNRKGVSTPPTISVQLIQTASEFTFDDFERTVDGKTNRGTVYLVPVGDIQCSNKNFGICQDNMIYVKAPLEAAVDAARAENKEPETFLYEKNNMIPKEAFSRSNDKTTVNKPYVVYCDGNTTNEYACSALLFLPDPVGGDRNDDTFMFTVAIPYEQPDTDFTMEFLCKNSSSCPNTTYISDGESGAEKKTATLDGVQVRIDSTGRANDLFRRVETLLEATDTSFAYPFYAVQLLGEGGTDALVKKNLEEIITEWCVNPSNDTVREQCKKP